jgi:hypothetical protein
MSFGTWTVRSMYRSGSLMTVARELAKYKLDLVGIQEVRWEKAGTVRAREYTFSMAKGRKIINWEQVFLYTRSAIKRVEFVSDRMSYIVLRGCWCNIIVLNAHTPTEEKGDDSKDSFYEELEGGFDHFPKYQMKILLGDFNAKVAREVTFKQTIGNESLHQDSNDNGVRAVNFATSKNLVVKSTMFPHQNIHKYTWTSPDGKTHNQINHILIDRRWHSSILHV